MEKENRVDELALISILTPKNMEKEVKIDGFALRPIYDSSKSKVISKMKVYISKVEKFKSSLIWEIMSTKKFDNIKLSRINKNICSNKSLKDATFRELLEVDIVTLNNMVYGYENMFNALLEKLDARDKEIILLRAKGATLATVGNIVGVTRERVRQLEKRIIEKFYNLTSMSLIYVVDENGNINLEHFEVILNVEKLQLLTYLIHSHQNVFYIKTFDKFVFSKNEIFDDYDVDLKELLVHTYIPIEYIEEKATVINGKGYRFITEEDLSTYLLMNRYVKKDNHYISVKLTAPPFIFVIRKYYKNGINLEQLNETSDYLKLIEITKKEFPSIDIETSPRSLIARLAEHIVPIDRSLYISKDDFTFDRDCIMKVFDYMNNSTSTTFYFNELVSKYNETLSVSGLGNRYKLRSALVIVDNENYDYTRDAVYKKNTEFVNLETTISEYLRKMNRAVSLEEIRSEFKHTSVERVNFALMTNNDNLNWGYGYYRNKQTIDTPPDTDVSVKKVMEILDSKSFIEFDKVFNLFQLNEDFSILNLRYSANINAILKNYFSDQFIYNDGNIWLKDSFEECSYKRILFYLNKSANDEISLNDIKRLCNKLKLEPQVQSLYLKILNENRLMKDKNYFHKEGINLSETEVSLLLDNINRIIKEYNFTSSKMLLKGIDFIPKSFYWTEESITHCVKKYCYEKYSFIPTGLNKTITKYGLIVKGKENTEGLMSIVEYFRQLNIKCVSLNELTDLLVELGVVKLSIPISFLDSDSYNSKESSLVIK